MLKPHREHVGKEQLVKQAHHLMSFIMHIIEVEFVCYGCEGALVPWLKKKPLLLDGRAAPMPVVGNPLGRLV